MDPWVCILCGYEDNTASACTICGASRILAEEGQEEKAENKSNFGNDEEKQKFVVND